MPSLPQQSMLPEIRERLDFLAVEFATCVHCFREVVLLAHSCSEISYTLHQFFARKLQVESNHASNLLPKHHVFCGVPGMVKERLSADNARLRGQLTVKQDECSDRSKPDFQRILSTVHPSAQRA